MINYLYLIIKCMFYEKHLLSLVLQFGSKQFTTMVQNDGHFKTNKCRIAYMDQVISMTIYSNTHYRI